MPIQLKKFQVWCHYTQAFFDRFSASRPSGFAKTLSFLLDFFLWVLRNFPKISCFLLPKVTFSYMNCIFNHEFAISVYLLLIFRLNSLVFCYYFYQNCLEFWVFSSLSFLARSKKGPALHKVLYCARHSPSNVNRLSLWGQTYLKTTFFYHQYLKSIKWWIILLSGCACCNPTIWVPTERSYYSA